MKLRGILLAAALAACATSSEVDTPPQPLQPTPAVDVAGNTLDELIGQGEEKFCWENDAWCVSASTASVPTFDRGAEITTFESPDAQGYTAWRHGIVEADGSVIFGFVDTRTTMYSGGDAYANQLTLYRAAPGAAPVQIASLPFGGSARIRACFSAEQAAARLQSCQDEYFFNGRIELDTTNTDAAPRLILQTEARTYPNRRSRDEDSTQAPPLTRADQTWWRDPECSYRIVLTRGADGQYRPERPLPACSDYLEL
ncbi:hypothetical protein [Vitreimonas flagellata]|uniref:hypothetical protein n=1 Tax=Vitreimonas flagellata TaxID=2560861 RepID=UPI001074B1F2|nr:hypothetical protein [Vitreimonas flagellata]